MLCSTGEAPFAGTRSVHGACASLPSNFYKDMKSNDELQKEIEARDILLDKMTAQLAKALEEMVFWQNRAKHLEQEFAPTQDEE